MIAYTFASLLFGLVLFVVIAASAHWLGWTAAIVITLVVSVGWGLWSSRLFRRR